MQLLAESKMEASFRLRDAELMGHELCKASRSREFLVVNSRKETGSLAWAPP